MNEKECKFSSRKAFVRLELCYQKNVHYIVEQPKTSLLYSYRPMKASCN